MHPRKSHKKFVEGTSKNCALAANPGRIGGVGSLDGGPGVIALGRSLSPCKHNPGESGPWVVMPDWTWRSKRRRCAWSMATASCGSRVGCGTDPEVIARLLKRAAADAVRVVVETGAQGRAVGALAGARARGEGRAGGLHLRAAGARRSEPRAEQDGQSRCPGLGAPRPNGPAYGCCHRPLRGWRGWLLTRLAQTGG